MRISTTTLESFRLFMTGDWMAEDDLVATIRGAFVPTPAVLLGQAFGRVLEAPDAYRVEGGYRCGDYQFDDATMAPALALIDRRGVFEAKAVKAYGPHDVVAKADHLLGRHLSEFKTTTGLFNFDKYADSCQWRFMADIFDVRQITYRVFLLEDHLNGVAELRGIENFNLYTYDGLPRDCAELVGEFTEYVQAKGLAGLLERRQQEAA